MTGVRGGRFTSFLRALGLTGPARLRVDVAVACEGYGTVLGADLSSLRVLAELDALLGAPLKLVGRVLVALWRSLLKPPSLIDARGHVSVNVYVASGGVVVLPTGEHPVYIDIGASPPPREVPVPPVWVTYGARARYEESDRSTSSTRHDRSS